MKLLGEHSSRAVVDVVEHSSNARSSPFQRIEDYSILNLPLHNAILNALEECSTTSTRSEERRVGKECSDECRSRWSPYH